MNNFFTQGLSNISKNSDVLESDIKKLESNTSGNFFTQHLSTTPSSLEPKIILDTAESNDGFFTQGVNLENVSKEPEFILENSESSDAFFIQNSLTNLDQTDEDLFGTIGTVEIENFFGQNKSEYNFLREYSKGKSFQFSTWNPYDTYNNDEFVQDFVKYDKKLWACVSKTPVINIPPYESTDLDAPWELILDGVSNMEFRQVGNQIQWKYEDGTEWYLLFELVSVSKNEILEMLDNLGLRYDSVDEFSELKIKIEEIKILINSESQRAQSVESELNNLIKILNGTGDGSIKKIVSDSITQLNDSVNTKINKLEEDVDGRLTLLEKLVSGGEIEGEGDSTTLLRLIASNTSKINQLDSKVQVIDNSTEWLEFE